DRPVLLERAGQHRLDPGAVHGAAAPGGAAAGAPADHAAARPDVLPHEHAPAERRLRGGRRGHLQPAVRSRLRAHQLGPGIAGRRQDRLADRQGLVPCGYRGHGGVEVDRVQHAHLPGGHAGRAQGRLRGGAAGRRLAAPAALPHHRSDDPPDDRVHGDRLDDLRAADLRRAAAVRRRRAERRHRRRLAAVPDADAVPVRARVQPGLRVRLRLGGGLDDVRRHRAHRAAQLPVHPTHQARLVTTATTAERPTAAGPSDRRPPAAVSARKRRAYLRLMRNRPGRLAYLTLVAVLFFSAFPLYYSVVVASRDNSALGQIPPPVLPGANLVENVERVFTTVPFDAALINSVVVS